jgi:hypothetical protein
MQITALMLQYEGFSGILGFFVTIKRNKLAAAIKFKIKSCSSLIIQKTTIFVLAL